MMRTKSRRGSLPKTYNQVIEKLLELRFSISDQINTGWNEVPDLFSGVNDDPNDATSMEQFLDLGAPVVNSYS